jgi:hypothetical protein
MKKIFLSAAIIGMSVMAFGQQQQTTSTTKTKDSKGCSKACMKACGKDCKSGSCTANHDKKTTTTTTTTTSDKK